MPNAISMTLFSQFCIVLVYAHMLYYLPMVRSKNFGIKSVETFKIIAAVRMHYNLRFYLPFFATVIFGLLFLERLIICKLMIINSGKLKKNDDLGRKQLNFTILTIFFLIT